GLGDGLGLTDGLGLGTGDGIGVWPSSAPTLRSRSDTRHSNALSAVSPSELKTRTTPTMTSAFDLCFRRCLPLKGSSPETTAVVGGRVLSDADGSRDMTGRCGYAQASILGRTD